MVGQGVVSRLRGTLSLKYAVRLGNGC